MNDTLTQLCESCDGLGEIGRGIEAMTCPECDGLGLQIISVDIEELDDDGVD